MESVTFNQKNIGYSMESVLSPKKIGAPKCNRWLTILECHSWDCQQPATANISITGTNAAAIATVFCLGCNSFPHFRSLLLVVIAFHLQCVATWLNSSRQTCPICRADWEYGQSSDQRRVSEQNP